MKNVLFGLSILLCFPSSAEPTLKEIRDQLFACAEKLSEGGLVPRARFLSVPIMKNGKKNLEPFIFIFSGKNVVAIPLKTKDIKNRSFHFQNGGVLVKGTFTKKDFSDLSLSTQVITPTQEQSGVEQRSEMEIGALKKSIKDGEGYFVNNILYPHVALSIAEKYADETNLFSISNIYEKSEFLQDLKLVTKTAKTDPEKAQELLHNAYVNGYVGITIDSINNSSNRLVSAVAALDICAEIEDKTISTLSKADAFVLRRLHIATEKVKDNVVKAVSENFNKDVFEKSHELKKIPEMAAAYIPALFLHMRSAEMGRLNQETQRHQKSSEQPVPEAGTHR